VRRRDFVTVPAGAQPAAAADAPWRRGRARRRTRL